MHMYMHVVNVCMYVILHNREVYVIYNVHVTYFCIYMCVCKLRASYSELCTVINISIFCLSLGTVTRIFS